MAKFKIINKGYKKEVKVRLTRGESINDDELHRLSACSANGLIAPTLIGKRKLLYIVSGKVTLAQYMSQQMSTKRFLGLLMQVVDVTRSLRKKGLSNGRLTLDKNFIFVNEATKRLMFIYRPINSKDEANNIFAFFAYMLSTVSLLEGDGWQSVNKISNFINSQRIYSPEDFKQYLLKIEPGLADEREEEPQRNSFETKGDRETGTVILEEDETSILEGTSLLEEEDPWSEEPFNERSVRAYIIRERTQEKIEVDKPAFRIGKEKSYVDCFINNNNAVSRIHADIVQEGNAYYIKDNNSTNGTFVNGKVIKGKSRMEIHSGDAIMLANERFTFLIERDR